MRAAVLLVLAFLTASMLGACAEPALTPTTTPRQTTTQTPTRLDTDRYADAEPWRADGHAGRRHGRNLHNPPGVLWLRFHPDDRNVLALSPAPSVMPTGG